jgi:hypothetical protein
VLDGLVSFLEPSIPNNVFVATSIQAEKCDVVNSLALFVRSAKSSEAQHVSSRGNRERNLLMVEVVVGGNPLFDCLSVQAH